MTASYIPALFLKLLLNQAQANQRPACTWFLNIACVHDISMCMWCVCVCVCMCARVRVHVCVSIPEAFNGQWHDMDPILLVKQVLQLLCSNFTLYC